MALYDIPSDREIDWTAGTHVGVIEAQRFVPTGGTFNVVDYGADMTGVADSTSALTAAITAAKNASGIAYVPAGTLKFTGFTTGLSWNNWTLRGAGKFLTTLKYVGGIQTAINIGTGSSFNYPVSGNTITAGLTKGSTSVTIGSTSDFSVGQIIRIRWTHDTNTARMEAGTSPVAIEPHFGSGAYGAQTVVITAKTSSTLTFWPPFHQSLHSSVTATVYQSAFPTKGVALEDFTLDNEGNASVIFPIQFQDCYNCSIKNVRSYKTNNYHFYLSACVNCEIINSDCEDRNSSGSNGAGILYNSTNSVLVEGCLSKNVFPNIEINQSSTGNVFGCNCFEGSTTNTNHGPYNRFNLYERNIIRDLQSDGYFGGEGELTLFGNWIHSTNLAISDQSYGISLNRWCHKASMLDNLIGNSSRSGSSNLSTGNPNLGNSYFNGTASPTTADWWYDWDVSNNRVKRWTGTVTTKTSSTSGTVTLDSGQQTDFNASLALIDGTQRSANFASVIYCTAASGNITTCTGSNGTFPEVGTAVTFYPGMGGFQEKDDDVANTLTKLANRYWTSSSSDYYSGESPGSTTFPDSYYRGSAPSWWPSSLSWPPQYSASLTHEENYELNPAGYRLVNGSDAGGGGGDTTPPTPNPSTVASVAVNGTTQITVVANTAVDAVSAPVQYNHSIDGTYQGWQSSATRAFTGLTPATSYSFRVKARDSVGNETTQSSASVAVTDSNASATPNPLGNRGTQVFTFGAF